MTGKTLLKKANKLDTDYIFDHVTKAKSYLLNYDNETDYNIAVFSGKKCINVIHGKSFRDCYNNIIKWLAV